MAQTASSVERHSTLLAKRLVRYRDLRPCTTAFIDTRTPNSAQKENFTIIGPGVAENPDQHVHIEIPHGFNIGGARQPPGCVNSQHSHETAEVFVVHSGRWAFHLGANQEDGDVILSPGDTISIPVHVFRGFTNIGDGTGFMFAVLGGDDPGRVTWAPSVFESAKEYGLVLLEDGNLIDTTKGEKIPPGKRAMPPTTEDDVAKLSRLTAGELADCVVSHEEAQARAQPAAALWSEAPLIGAESPRENMAAGRMAWQHGFHLRHVRAAPGAETTQHVRHEEEVIMLHQGQLTVLLPDGEVELTPGDVLTTPIGMPRSFLNRGTTEVEAYVVRGGNHPEPAAAIN